MKQIVNFSGGKDSTAMLHLMLEKVEQIDDVIFFDGGWEWPQMYEHIELVEKKTGIKISRAKPSKPFDYWFSEHRFQNKKFGELQGYGWPVAMGRWCTRLKIDAIRHYLIENYFMQDVVQCVGFAVGEEKRMERKSAEGHRFPLVENNMDELDCLKYCYDMGYTFGGLYEKFHRVSCWCCPLSSTKEWFMMKRHEPEMWERLKQMDARLKDVRQKNGMVEPRPFRQDCELLEIDTKIRGKN
ncbi:MAG: phosphoadenosine phosphosulfate reductase family protein [Firmicutes bacterium]|nr:phosphoadenosine phosphosulfate reductase family protein [Bacillota bacterium]